MADPDGRECATSRRHPHPGLRRALCCSFAPSTWSPDRPPNRRLRPHNPAMKPLGPAPLHVSGSPSRSSRLGLGIIDPRRRILSPGRVSPIDSVALFEPLTEVTDYASVASTVTHPEPEQPDPVAKEGFLEPEKPVMENAVRCAERSLDMRLILKGKDGKFLILELDPKILSENSVYFAAKLLDSTRKLPDAGANSSMIEIASLDNVHVFKDTIELMYEKEPVSWLTRAGVSRAIDILEVSSTIMFDRGIKSCLMYIEAVPWNESEEEKLKNLLARCKFDGAISEDMLSRLGPQDCDNSVGLAMHLIRSVTEGTNRKARKEAQSLITGLLSGSSVYRKEHSGLDREKLYDICYTCLESLVQLFEEGTGNGFVNQTLTRQESKPLLESISKQVENLNWLLEILIENEMAEDFVRLWANQEELILMHARASPMMRYEVSRISANIFMATGRRKLQCQCEVRLSVLSAWFVPMLADFGWLQRCSKGLDVRMLEESLGQVLLTLPLKQQQSFFEEWFCRFAEHGTECPNLGKAFQVWWRRLFGRSSGTCG